MHGGKKKKKKKKKVRKSEGLKKSEFLQKSEKRHPWIYTALNYFNMYHGPLVMRMIT